MPHKMGAGTTMAEQSSALKTGDHKASPRLTPARIGVIAVIALLPAAIGLFHLFVHPLVPFPAQRYAAQSSPQADSAPATAPYVSARPVGLARAEHALATLYTLVFWSCTATCLALGLLGVPHAIAFALLQACVTTLAYMISDGQGAFVGPIVWTFLFWPLIGIGKLIQAKKFVRHHTRTN